MGTIRESAVFLDNAPDSNIIQGLSKLLLVSTSIPKLLCISLLSNLFLKRSPATIPLFEEEDGPAIHAHWPDRQDECDFTAFITRGLDLHRDFVDRYNHELIDIHRMTPESMEPNLHHLRSLIIAHVEATGSEWGAAILDDYRTFLPKFWLVKPKAAELGSLIESLRRAA